jgi:alkanesulfonate monooxygenase SsuD/methylene tetrahydromethanopterin reductase-like flavin-dependent oxidoreductase (luciferase family)
MKIGLQIPDLTWPGGPAELGATLARVAATADRNGFEYIALMDHFFQIKAVGPAENDMLEAYTSLASSPLTPSAPSCSCWSRAPSTGIRASWPSR